MKHTLSTIPPFEISRGFNARFVHTDSMTLAFVEVDTGAALPEHALSHFTTSPSNTPPYNSPSPPPNPPGFLQIPSSPLLSRLPGQGQSPNPLT